jgi:NAD(P)-dependent dehydrogenase (short-subunit alcohol dehydrogenase family)
MLAMTSLAGRVAFVTGGARGIGAATAEALAAAGASVMLADVRSEGEETAARLREGGADVAFHPLDVTDEGQWQAALDACAEKFGGIDILVNNAGVLYVAPMAETTLADFRRVQSINVDGCFLGMKHAIPRIAARAERWAGGGAIVNLSSVAGLIGNAHAVAYCASKGAIRLMTKAAAVECLKLGNRVRVNSVHPGAVQTAMQDQVMRDLPAAARSGNSGRVATAAEIAGTILFLCSDAAAFMTGSELVVDNGYTAQ